MSSFRLAHNLNRDEEISFVTTKQYLAIADDFLRRLFPEITPDRLPRPGAFTVFIADDDSVIH